VADFGVGEDYPLTKSKFGGFNSGMLKLTTYQRDVPLLEELRLPSMRVDLAWGARWAGWSVPPVGGTASEPAYHWAEMDAIAGMLNRQGTLPYWSYCYVPDPLQRAPGDYRSMPADVARWGQVLAAMARHCREARPGGAVGYHEVYNEPDNRDFLHATVDEYLSLYRAGVKGLREGDPDAVVGGPALAFTDSWVPPFLDAVVRERLPLDFFSFHFYPTVPYKSQTVAAVIEDMRRQLASRPQLATSEMHLNEYNAYRIDYPQGGSQDRYPLASALLHDYRYFLSQPDLTQVSWAQILDTGGGNYSGMVSIGGHPKAVFNAAAIYARMPVDRKRVGISGAEGVEGMASADEHRVGVVLWNRAGELRELKVRLRGVPFRRGTLRVYRIDANHASWTDNPSQEQLAAVETHAFAPGSRLSWSGTLHADGVVYLEVEDGRYSEPAPVPMGRILRVLRYFPNRDTRSYGDFDRRTWTARLGMASEERAQEQLGVMVEGLPAAARVRVSTEGRLRKLDANSLLGLRCDYQVGAGYAKSVLFHGRCGRGPDLFSAQRDAPMPWGTGRQADQAVTVRDLRGFALRFRDHAPPGWTGRAILTPILQNAGPGVRALVSLEPW
jgi:hypothetical protein